MFLYSISRAASLLFHLQRNRGRFSFSLELLDCKSHPHCIKMAGEKVGAPAFQSRSPLVLIVCAPVGLLLAAWIQIFLREEFSRDAL